ncbi:MAG TPA: copper-binding protein [Thermoanaerobaculia bacterium]|nr:copper-binding protein [Thermoanaerobaculia bacterium]
MRPASLLAALLLVALACSKSERDKPLSEPGERLYPLRGRIEARDGRDNVLRVKHEEIPGFMKAMTMDFSVRGAEVASLPPDGAEIEARLHVTGRAYWLTDVKSR